MSDEEKRARLARAARAVYGEAWVYRLAKAQGVTVRAAQRWASGERGVPEHILQGVEIDASLPSIDILHDALRTATMDALAAGLAPQAVAGKLRDFAAMLLKRA